MTSVPVLLPSAFVGAQRSLRSSVGRFVGRFVGWATTQVMALAVAAVPAPAFAATVEDAQDAANRQTRAELNAQRAAVQKAYDEKIKDCRTRFVVTGCLEAAHAWRIEALRPIQAQEIEVNALERRQRAAAQRERVMAKDQEAREAAASHSAPAVKAAARAASATVLPPSRQPRANPEAHQKQLEREKQAAERKAAERRQAAADRESKQKELQRSAKEQAEKRAAKPADPKKPAPAHLPTPAASDIKALPGR